MAGGIAGEAQHLSHPILRAPTLQASFSPSTYTLRATGLHCHILCQGDRDSSVWLAEEPQKHHTAVGVMH